MRIIDIIQISNVPRHPTKNTPLGTRVKVSKKLLEYNPNCRPLLKLGAIGLIQKINSYSGNNIIDFIYSVYFPSGKDDAERNQNFSKAEYLEIVF